MPLQQSDCLQDQHYIVFYCQIVSGVFFLFFSFLSLLALQIRGKREKWDGMKEKKIILKKTCGIKLILIFLCYCNFDICTRLSLLHYSFDFCYPLISNKKMRMIQFVWIKINNI